ncbi:Preprotein translocase subunit Sec66 [Seminavis robusta]|uniref:Preprotein translocase subunit Sec66 n=1 Tax=Seminavis robusta TaxID=568900 RepID=A0A9N8E3D6_9STRA|nr:Preprotein translocase subunit Sec66 [Seminavis robusta]|eukprot:Sro461_g147750.1 Preprotein translocase subunit Sec66 (292) ;mRNA; f:29123-30371
MVEVNVEPDGSTTFENAGEDAGAGQEEAFTGGEEAGAGEETMEEVAKAIDPAIYLLIAVVIFLIGFVIYQRKKKEEEEDDFFSNLDGEKFNLKLPAEVDEYYTIRAKCESAGWKPGMAKSAENQGPHRVMAQALMKRAIADIPVVTHIQKESAGMNKLYSQSMCSVKQWRAYQNAEAMVSQEVEEVRAEADEIEPGWSQAIWRQAMQYHQMLKQKHEQEAKALDDQAKRRKEIEEKVNAEKMKQKAEKDKADAAEKAAQELIKEEERVKNSKKAFAAGGGMKKGFLDQKKK